MPPDLRLAYAQQSAGVFTRSYGPDLEGLGEALAAAALPWSLVRDALGARAAGEASASTLSSPLRAETDSASRTEVPPACDVTTKPLVVAVAGPRSDSSSQGSHGLSPDEQAQNAVLDAVADGLAREARAFALRIARLVELSRLAERDPSGHGAFMALEMAGSWNLSQQSASRWADDAERYTDCLPITLSMLRAGTLFVHLAQVLLTRTRHCSLEVSRKVEAEVLPSGAGLCPADLRKRVDRAVLRLTSEQTDPATAEQRHADAVAGRRTSVRPDLAGMGIASALLPAEQLVAWQDGLDQLERRERAADRAAGVDRTADQRRADLFAALPALVLAGTAQDRSAGAADGRLTGPAGHAGPAASGSSDAAVLVRAGVSPLVPWTFSPQQVCAQVVLHVLVPVATALDLSQEPASLGRYGPISAEHARLLVPHSVRRVLVDGHTGVPVHVDDRAQPAAVGAEAWRRQLRGMLDRAPVVFQQDAPDEQTDPGAARRPAALPRPVDPDAARRPAARLAPVEETQYVPSASLARLVDLRDQRCNGPGCSGSRCDRDHLVPWPEGPTAADNLGLLSRRCHRAKHGGWGLRRERDGTAVWRSPLGRTYRRPGPHPRPPRVDLRQPSPPLRPRPVAGPPSWVTGRDAARPAETVPADEVRTRLDRDAPPPF